MDIDLDIIYKYAGKNSILNTGYDDKKVDFTGIDDKIVTVEDYGLLVTALQAYENNIHDFTFINKQKERLKYLDQYLDIPALALFYSDLDYKLLSRLISNDYVIIPVKLFKSDKILGDFYKYGGRTEFDWMLKFGLIKLDCNLSVYFAKNGNLELLRYAREKGCPWNDDTTYVAAKNGWLNCLRYAHENGCPWDEHTTYGAVRNGYSYCLRYAHENDCPWDRTTTGIAAYLGHLNCIRYAYEHGCPWDEFTTYGAARYGHLECLRYAYEHGCPINIEVCLKNAHENCKEFLLKLKSQN